MRLRNISARFAWLISISILAGGGHLLAADAPSAKLALSFRPVQKDVEYETPTAAEYGKCKVEVERSGKSSGWVVVGPNGQVLRRFMDTNSDNIVDQWRYFKHGLEVYRDIDSNYNNKVDQSRWLNTGGTRWGIDKNEDGRIEFWKVLSAEEATREAVRAMVAGDAKALESVLISESDIKSLGIQSDLSKKLTEAVANPSGKLKSVLAGSKTITKQTKWMRFDSSTPSMIPSDAGKAKSDLRIYQNAMAIIETSGNASLLQIGELIEVGETWKLTQIPQPLEGNSVQITVGGIFLQPAYRTAGTTATADTGISPEMQKLLEELRKLDQNSPALTAGSAALAQYNSKRADMLTKLVNMSKTNEERDQWMRQMVDGIAAAVQTGNYPQGLSRLKSIEGELLKAAPKTPTAAYVSYRRLLAEYGDQLQRADNENRQKVQEWWLKELEDFAEKHPQAEDTPDALLQLAVAEEFAGKVTSARKWYGVLTKDHTATAAANRAAGALKRLDLNGQPLQLSGSELSGSGLKGGTVNASSFRGKVLLVLFWSTWCKPCTEDLPQVRALYQQYHDRGFEILGVNLDTNPDLIQPYMSQHRVTWPQIHQAGGLESKPAIQFGIISLPTMFLVDRTGKVVNRNVSVTDLKTILPEMLKLKK